MQIKTSFPHPIREIENIFIRLADGTKLAARIWMPVDAEQTPVPAILEYIPYRKNDGTALRDSIRHPYVAGHGYACVRVDMRGSGDSDGLLLDEYLLQEQDDALEVLKWIAEQQWCSGNVGIIGKSWGGFNGLQIAARRPPELKCLITVCSTDDRYADDVHYMGGCLLASDMLAWASIMLLYNAKPPDPKFVGERWREMWLNRLENTPPFVEAWLAHQRRDAFWKHGSVCETFGRPQGGRPQGSPLPGITCAVYAIGGWADGYTNAIPRLLEGLSCPRKGLIGPWAHTYPEEGVPEPAIGFNQECLRWWDYWLKGIDNGIMDEPMLRSYILEDVPPAPTQVTWPGKWVADSTWPPSSISNYQLLITNNGLSNSPAPESQFTLTGAQANGLNSGVWCAYGLPGDFPSDQRPDDGLSLCFDSAPFDSSLDILGFPEVTLTVSVDQPNALIAVRLCDVSPTGSSALITRGLLNLAHRDSHEHPSPVEPGKRYTVTVQLNAIGYSLAQGHKIRAAVSPTYWPFAWPSPAPVTLTLFAGHLNLPIRSPQSADEALKPFEPPEISAPLSSKTLRAPSRRREAYHNVINNKHTLIDHNDAGSVRYPDGLEYDNDMTDTFTIVEGDPLSAAVRCDRSAELRRGDWRVRLETSSVMTSDATTFRVTNAVDAYEGHTRVFSKTWTFAVPRDMV